MIVWLPGGREEVVQPTSQSVPAPETNARLLQPEIALPSLVKETVPPPSLGETNARKVTGWPGFELSVDEYRLTVVGSA